MKSFLAICTDKQLGKYLLRPGVEPFYVRKFKIDILNWTIYYHCLEDFCIPDLFGQNQDGADIRSTPGVRCHKGAISP